jgi:flavin-binding protein dodecin
MLAYEIDIEIKKELKAFYKANRKILKAETGSINPRIHKKSQLFLAEAQRVEAKYQSQLDAIQKAEAQRAEAQRAEAQEEAFKKSQKTLATLSLFDINEIQSEIEYGYNGHYSEALRSAQNMGYTGLKCTNAQLVAQIEKLSSFDTIEDVKARAEITEALTETFTIGEK